MQQTVLINPHVYVVESTCEYACEYAYARVCTYVRTMSECEHKHANMSKRESAAYVHVGQSCVQSCVAVKYGTVKFQTAKNLV